MPSLFVKLTGQFPAYATIEPEIKGTWIKFLNNDGQEVMIDGQCEEFKLKALAFAHWTFHKFKGKVLVCDLQGNCGKTVDGVFVKDYKLHEVYVVRILRSFEIKRK